MSTKNVPLSKYWKRLKPTIGSVFSGTNLFQVATIPQSYFDNSFKHLQESSNRAAGTVPIQVQHNTEAINALLPTQSLLPPNSLTPTQSVLLQQTINQYNLLFEKLFSLLPIILLVSSISLLILVVLYYALRFYLFKKALLHDSEEKAFLIVKPPANTSQTAFSTEQLFASLHSNTKQQSFWNKFFPKKQTLSLELVSTKTEGIRYIIQTIKQDSPVLKKTLLSYLPSASVTESADYLPEAEGARYSSIIEFSLTNHFSIPLKDQKTLKEHDPIAYLTGHMTKLEKDELIAMQVVLTPVTNKSHRELLKTTDKLSKRIWNDLDISEVINGVPRRTKILRFILNSFAVGIYLVLWEVIIPLRIIRYILNKSDSPFIGLPFGDKPKPVTQTDLQKEYFQSIQKKIDAKLFETTIRVFVSVNSKSALKERTKGISSSFSSFTNPSLQAFFMKDSIFERILKLVDFVTRKNLSYRLAFLKLKYRLLSPFDFNLPFLRLRTNPILSLSEITDLYHLPYTDTTKTENIVKVYSKELPSPLSLKGSNTLDVIFADNAYGGETTPIGLNKEERRRHVFAIGQTGSGKSTLLLTSINYDIDRKRGVAVIDPHGNLADDVMACIPEDRIDDVILLDPDDLSNPIGINLLELTPGLTDDDSEREKEFVCESVISLFRKVFLDSTTGSSPHRIEEILRNTIYTAFTVPDCTIFTLYDLLEDPKFRDSVVNKLEDERLKKFWKNIFNKAGDYQQVKMIAPITARVGRFLFSPSARRILEQPKSTINFDKIMDEGKILICNLSRGKLGEDTSVVLGIMIMNKLQLAALKRARVPEQEREDFYLYVDEFQHFATPSFIKMLSEARKYRLNVFIAEQTTSQQTDPNDINMILANTGTVICFKSANPQDEKLLLPQFAPYVEKGEILNLPSFHFYIKLGAMNPEEAFSGVTTPVEMNRDEVLINMIKQASRKNYAITYVKPEKKEEPIQTNKSKKKDKIKSVIDIGTLS